MLRLRPNPHRIQFCILKTLQKCSGYAIFQIAYGRLTSFFFGFSFHGKRILPQNPVYICLGSLQRTHLHSGLLEIRIHGFFLRQKLGIFRLQALDGGQLFETLLIKKLLCCPVQKDFGFMFRKKSFRIACFPIGHINVTGLGVVDDMLLHDLDFCHPLLFDFYIRGKYPILSGGSCRLFLQSATVQQAVFFR